jgi:hypothetical protein
VPMVRYDPRYVGEIGKWMLNVANNARYSYGSELAPEEQFNYDWIKEYDPDGVIAYEGIQRYAKNGINFYATGMYEAHPDHPSLKTNMSIYTSAVVGQLGGIIEGTNDEKILKIDCLANDYYRKEAYPTYLYYNPYPEEKEIEIDVGDKPVMLYDAASNSMITERVSGVARFRMLSETSRVVVILPENSKITTKNGIIYANSVFIGLDRPTVSILSPDRQNEVIEANFDVKLKAHIPGNDKIEEFLLKFDDTVIFKGKEIPQSIPVNIEKLPSKEGYITAEIITKRGLTDKSSVKVTIINKIIETVVNFTVNDITAWEPNIRGGQVTIENNVAVIQDKSWEKWKNDGAYGGVISPLFVIDMKRHPKVVVDIDSVDINWLFQIQLEGVTGYKYLMADGVETGRFSFDIKNRLMVYRITDDYNDVFKVRLVMSALGVPGYGAGTVLKGTKVGINEIRVYYDDTVVEN